MTREARPVHTLETAQYILARYNAINTTLLRSVEKAIKDFFFTCCTDTPYSYKISENQFKTVYNGGLRQKTKKPVLQFAFIVHDHPLLGSAL